MKYFVIYLILIILLPSVALSRDYSYNIGITSIYNNINEPGYQYVNEYEQIKNPVKDSLKSVSVGVSKNLKKNYVINITTNRLYSKETKRTTKHKRTNTALTSRSRVRADTLQFGKRYGRFLLMSSWTNLKINKSLWNNGNFLGRKINHTFVFGNNVTYFFNKNISGSFLCLFPNKEINLEFGCGVGLNYNF